jgi:cystathionine gamma-synthase
VALCTTKPIAGHSDLLMGAVVTADPELAESLVADRRRRGAVPGALEAFLALRGLRTLPVRLERSEATARELVLRLAAHPAVRRVHYPGFGAFLSFELDSREAADRVCEAVRLIVHATSLGGVESLIERRARWSGEDLVPETLIRLSVGLEHVEDLWDDLAQALSRA